MDDRNNDKVPATVSHDILLDRTKADEDLERLYRMAVEKASGAISYYVKAKKWKRIWARVIRFFAILQFSVAGLIPLIHAAGLFSSDADSGPFALLVAASAAALIGMDKFFGFSSSWARFVEAELSIRRRLDRFQIDWALANASLHDDEERKRPIECLQMLKDFSMEISQINEDETKVWISEYQNALTARLGASGTVEDGRQGVSAVETSRT